MLLPPHDLNVNFLAPRLGNQRRDFLRALRRRGARAQVERPIPLIRAHGRNEHEGTSDAEIRNSRPADLPIARELDRGPIIGPRRREVAQIQRPRLAVQALANGDDLLQRTTPSTATLQNLPQIRLGAQMRPHNTRLTLIFPLRPLSLPTKRERQTRIHDPLDASTNRSIDRMSMVGLATGSQGNRFPIIILAHEIEGDVRGRDEEEGRNTSQGRLEGRRVLEGGVAHLHPFALEGAPLLGPLGGGRQRHDGRRW